MTLIAVSCKEWHEGLLKSKVKNVKYFNVKEYEQLLLEFTSGHIFSLIFARRQEDGQLTASPQFFKEEYDETK